MQYEPPAADGHQQMTHRCTLETDGFGVSFELTSEPQIRSLVMHDIKLISELVLDPAFGGASFRSTLTYISVRDVRDLVTYLEEHIVSLWHSPDTVADVFVPLELGFQMQAQAGGMLGDGPDQGEFSLRVLINMGQRDQESTRLYLGGEAVVTFDAIHDFTSQLLRAVEGMYQG